MYGCQIWTQKLCSVTGKLSILQTIAGVIMTFSDFKAHSEPLLKKFDILKFKDNIVLHNCLFVNGYLEGNLPNSFINTFKRVDASYPEITRNAVTGRLVIPPYKTRYTKCID